MQPLSTEAQTQLDEYLKGVARIMYEHTEPEKLKSFESIEWEVRGQMLDKVAPAIGEFFYPREGKRSSGSKGQ
jgi:hypothetical protein